MFAVNDVKAVRDWAVTPPINTRLASPPTRRLLQLETLVRFRATVVGRPAREGACAVGRDAGEKGVSRRGSVCVMLLLYVTTLTCTMRVPYVPLC